MRLFASWKFLFSNSNEQVVNEIGSYRQTDTFKQTKQTVGFGDAGQATIAFGATYNIPWVSATSSKSRLLDLSLDGNCYVKITQDSVVQQIPLKGTTLLPARLTLSLKGTVSLIQIVSLEASADTHAQWMFAEYVDVTSAANFPVV